MCANCCAEAALQLETVAKSGDFGHLERSLESFKNEFRLLQSALIEMTPEVDYESACC
jgi:hypothetical protein